MRISSSARRTMRLCSDCSELPQATPVLVELDATITGAEANKNQSAWLDAKLDALRAQALLEALDKRRFPDLPADPDLNDSAYKQKRSDIQRLALSQ